MGTWLKLENAPAIIASLSAASLGFAVIFLLGYARDSSYVILSYASYHDVLLIAAQAFLTNIGFVAAGVVVQFTVEVPERNPQETTEKKPWSFKLFDFVAHPRLPTRMIVFVLWFVAYIVADEIPKWYLGKFSGVILFVGFLSYLFFVIRSARPTASWINLRSLVVSGMFVCMATYYFGNYEFYSDLFFSPVLVTTSSDINGQRHFALVRKVTDSLVLFQQESGRLVISDKNLGTFFIIDSPICNESSYHRRLRLQSSHQECK